MFEETSDTESATKSEISNDLPRNKTVDNISTPTLRTIHNIDDDGSYINE